MRASRALDNPPLPVKSFILSLPCPSYPMHPAKGRTDPQRADTAHEILL
jgi:hypothetical protein